MNVGLTGGIACGKSTVSKLFEERGARIVDADRIAREVVLPGQPALQSIIDTFGPAVVTEQGTLDRKRLGTIVFNDELARKQLEGILHPRIRAEMTRQMAEWNEREPSAIVIVDIPLLFESGLHKIFAFEHIIVVYAPRHIQLDRLMQRDSLSQEEAERRLSAQMPIEEKRELGDLIIDNSGALEATIAQVERLVERLT